MKNILIGCFVFLISFSGCNYLDLVPEDDIETIETIFEQRTQAELWLKTCYTFLQTNVGSSSCDPAFTGADEVVAGNFVRLSANSKYNYGFFIGDGLQMSQNPYGNFWTSSGYYAGIRYCNIFLDNIFRVYNMPDTEKRQWAAEIKGLKAFLYYRLMLHYGPIVLVPQNIDVTEPVTIMQQPRSHVDTCINAIVQLCNEAMKDLLPLNEKDISRKAYFNKEAVAALKAKALLLGASPLFNGNTAYANFKNKLGEPLVNAIYDKEKWHRAALAADSAVLLCDQGGIRLNIGSSSRQTSLLNTMNDIEYSVLAAGFENSEAILMRRCDYEFSDKWSQFTLPYIPQDKDYEQYSGSIRGGIGASMKMVEMFYTDHGLPIDMDREWVYGARYTLGRELNMMYRDVVPVNTMDVLRLHLRREPRFYACIAADRTYWQRGESASHNLLVEAYQGEKFGTDIETISSSVSQNLSGYWVKKGSYPNITGADYATSVGEEALVLIRLAELYLIQAEAWNEYEGPSEKVYAALDKIRTRAGIPGVKEAWTNYSTSANKVTSQVGMRDIIRQEWNIEFAFEGQRFWNLRRWLIAHEELNASLYGWNILGDNAAKFYNNYKEPIEIWSKRQFIAPRDYLFPLDAEEVLKSGCVQNPGW